jgi:hypothetical protein
VLFQISNVLRWIVRSESYKVNEVPLHVRGPPCLLPGFMRSLKSEDSLVLDSESSGP